MVTQMKTILIIFVVLVTAHAVNFHQFVQHQIEDDSVSNENVVVEWFDQRLDHFDAQNQQKWKQRYMYNKEFWKGSDSPVLLQLGGEGEASLKWMSSQQPYELAKKHNAVLMQIEHRYYGISQPQPDWSVESLKYLSSEQALEDIANFIEFSKESLGFKGPLIVIGGSYSGDLSAWFRLKYPHLCVGSWASSAPLRAKESFFEYDQAVREGLAAEAAGCDDSVRLAMRTAESQVFIDEAKTYAAFGAEGVSDPMEFLFVIADTVSFAVQYHLSYPELITKLCNAVMGQQSEQERMESFGKWTDFMFVNGTGNAAVDWELGTGPAANTSISTTNFLRPWTYQSCAEFGFFQDAPPQDSIRSTLLNVTWFRDEVCRKLFGDSFPQPADTAATNAEYGALDLETSKTTFTNGGLDPWRLLGAATVPNRDFGPETRNLVIDGGSHCSDMYSSKSGDSQALKDARVLVATDIANYLSPPPPPTPDCSKRSHCSGIDHGICVGENLCACKGSYFGPDCSSEPISPGTMWGSMIGVACGTLLIGFGSLLAYRKYSRSYRSEPLLSAEI